MVRKLKVRPEAASCHLTRRRGCGYLAAVVVPVSLMVWSHSRPAGLSAGWEYYRRKRVLDLARMTKNAPARCKAKRRRKSR